MEKCVLDTSALMSCCNIIERLKSEYNIIIPITVIEELDNLKTNRDYERSSKARNAIRHIRDNAQYVEFDLVRRVAKEFETNNIVANVYNMNDDIIVAVATSRLEAAISIIRLSGKDVIAFVQQFFTGKIINKESHTITYGYIKDNGEKIDEVLVNIYRGKRTFTGEEMVEINCHGGVYVVRRILETVIKYGARPADPGEFTKRAFLNGKMDLSQAEAVGDLISSKNEYALRSSVSQLKGNIKKEIQKIREEILYHTAFIETALDDPEHISVDGYGEKLEVVVEDHMKSLKHLLSTCDDGRMIKEGIKTVIVGKPNAGKSSLLNMLLGEDRAIVTEIAGTTRDALHEAINLHGISLNMIDTAGIHETQDVVEKIGVERAKKYAIDADLILYVVDASGNIDEDDQNIISLLDGKKAIILLNKSDLENKITEESLKENLVKRLKHSEDIRILRTSTIDPSSENSGMEELEETIRNMFFEGELKHNNELVVTNLRHKEALQDALHSLQLVERSIEDGMPEDFYSIDLTSAYASLGKIIGEEVDEDVVNEIFSKFCMGK